MSVVDAIGDILEQIFDPHADPIGTQANVLGRAWTNPPNARKCGKLPNRFVG